MRHFVTCTNCGKRIYFATNARHRPELPQVFPLTCLSCGVQANYSNWQALAEPGQLKAGGALIGGLFGLAAGGGAGALLGALLGGLLGQAQEPSEQAAVDEFNNSDGGVL